jgi:hypothetical protein
MALFLLYASKQGDRGCGQYNSCLAEGADEAAARVAAIAAAHNGEVKVLPTWAAVNLGAGAFPDARTVCFFQGRGPVSFLGIDTGGNKVPVV